MTRFFGLLFLLFLSCSQRNYTDKAGLDDAENTVARRNDTRALYYAVLDWAIVQKKVQDYGLIRNKKRIYIRKESPSFLWNLKEVKGSDLLSIEDGDTTQPSYRALTEKDVPSRMGERRFYLKTKEELETCADREGPFLYLTISQPQIKGDTARIQISNTWQPQTNSNVIYMSGGGHALKFIRKHGKWEPEAGHMNWVY